MATAIQRTRAIHLYRHALKNMLSWAVRREVFYPEAERIRGEFEALQGLDDPAAIERALEKGEAQLRSLLHPDPYIVPYRPGGSMYARNPPLPKEIKMHLDFGRHAGRSKAIFTSAAMATNDHRPGVAAAAPAGTAAETAVRVGPAMQTTSTAYTDVAKTPRGPVGACARPGIWVDSIVELTVTSLVFCYAVFYNTFGAAAFSSYGGWWMSFGLYGILAQARGGVLVGSGPYALKMLLALWGIITWIFMASDAVHCVLGSGFRIVTLELNFATFLLFFFLSVLFWFLSGGQTSITFIRIGGWWGLVTAGIAFYIAAADMINEQYKRTVLPVGKWNIGVPMAKGLKGIMRKIPLLGYTYVRACDREDRLAGFKKREQPATVEYERGDVERETGVYGRPGLLHSDQSITPGAWEGAAVYRERQTGDLGSALGPF
eukprot:scaffold21.g2205.t1